MRSFLERRQYLKHLFAAMFALTLLGGGVVAAYAHGQQGDDCPPHSTDPDCKKK